MIPTLIHAADNWIRLMIDFKIEMGADAYVSKRITPISIPGTVKQSDYETTIRQEAMDTYPLDPRKNRADTDQNRTFRLQHKM